MSEWVNRLRIRSLKSFENQIMNTLIQRLMVAGLLVVFVAVGIHYLAFKEIDERSDKEIRRLFEQALKHAELLDQDLNASYVQSVLEEVQRLDVLYEKRLQTDQSPIDSEMLYRIIDEDAQVIDSNHEKNLPNPFVFNHLLLPSTNFSLQTLNAEYFQIIRTVFETGTGHVVSAHLMDADKNGFLALYEPFTQDKVIEILIDQTLSKQEIRLFLNRQLSQIASEEDLSGILLSDSQKTIFAKGLLSSDARGSIDQSITEAYEVVDVWFQGRQLSLVYSRDTGIASTKTVLFFVWLIAAYGLSIMTLWFLMDKERQKILTPIKALLQAAAEAKSGRYDKRLEPLTYLEFAELGQAFNQMMERIEKLLDVKKNQEYQLRQLQLNEQQQVLSDSTGLDEALFTENQLRSEVLYNESLYIQLILTLSSAIEAKDHYTAGHCQRVMELSLFLATECGVSGQELEDICLGALLHDVGKLGLPEELLNKVEPLTDYEWSVLKRHTRFGEEILSDFNVSETTKKIVAMHHEHYDGNGYPKGEKDQDIPLGARIVCLVDAYDAMSCPRPYRLVPMTRLSVVKEIREQSGRQFDPQLVDLLCDWISVHGGDSHDF